MSNLNRLPRQKVRYQPMTTKRQLNEDNSRTTEFFGQLMTNEGQLNERQLVTNGQLKVAVTKT